MSILKYLNNMKGDDVNQSHVSSVSLRNQVHVFTDGSEIKQKNTYKTMGLGWGYLINVNKELSHNDKGSIEEGNNQRVELLAIYKALLYINKTEFHHSDITIYTDSEYSLKCITVWSRTWKRNGWKKTGTSHPVKHRDIIEPCVNLYSKLQQSNDVRFEHVRSHKYPKGYTGTMDYISKGNDDADQLATSASKSMLKLNICTS